MCRFYCDFELENQSLAFFEFGTLASACRVLCVDFYSRLDNQQQKIDGFGALASACRVSCVDFYSRLDNQPQKTMTCRSVDFRLKRGDCFLVLE